MADLNEQQAAGVTKITGSDSTGVETNYVNADANGNLLVKETSAGPVTPGTVASNSDLAGGQYNTALPTLTNGQQAALQLDSSGRLITAPQTIASGVADKSAFTYGTTNEQAIGGVYQDTSPTLTAGTQGAIRSTANRALHTNLRDSSGNEKLGQQTSALSIPVVLPSDQTINAALAANAMSSYSPDYSNYIAGTSPIEVDASGRLETHSTITTDEGSFRDDFSGTTLLTTLTGTVTFTNGSATVTGVGTNFIGIQYYDYIKLSTDANTAFAQIASVDSATQITLSTPYTGTSTTGTAVTSNWIPSIGTGGSQTVASGILNLISGTTSGSITKVTRFGDYLPYIGYGKFSISQNITNQTIVWGFCDQYPNPNKQALFIFSGTNNKSFTCQSSFDSSAQATQTTIVTQTGTFSLANNNKFAIQLTGDQVAFLVNDLVVALHKDHLPGPYDNLSQVCAINNTGVPASTTTMAIDYVYFSNLDEVQIQNTFTGEPIPTSLYGNSSTTGLPVPLQLDSNGNLIVTSLTGFGSAFSFGDVTTTTQTMTAVRRTAYTEQTTNAQRSIASASANDTAAGTGARIVTITYYDQTGAGPYAEVITLNGATGVNTVNTNICFIEKMIVTTAGSGGTNAGIITLYSATAKGGVVVGTINAGDGQTLWAHHYVPIGKTCNITGISAGSTSSVAGNGTTLTIRALAIGITGAVESQISDFVMLYGQGSQFSRVYASPIAVTGPARVTLYSTSNVVTSVRYFGAFDFFQP
jgi:hypothetical protein